MRLTPEIHPGIRSDKIPVKGPAGLLFALGAMTICLMGIPVTRLLLAVAVPTGILIALVLRFANRLWSGIILTLAGVTICVIEIPPLRWFLILAIPFGLAAALILHFTGRD